MGLKSSKKINANRYELEIEVSSDKFNEAIDKAYKKQVHKISIPGFRKGKAPKAFIEKFYGKSVFYDDAINDVYPYALDEAIEQAGIEVIDDKMKFDIVDVGDNGLVFKVELTTKPEVSIKDYKGIEVSAKSTEVTEEDIDHELNLVRERNSRLISVDDRPAEMGDTVIIDFEGFCDGVAFDGGKAEKYSLNLGMGGFIPGFEEQIVGHKIGEEFDINVKFPDEYQEEKLAGKDSVFKIKLHEIKKKELPEIDDEFIKDISEFNTLSEYRDDIKVKIAQRNEENAKRDIENQIFDKLAELVEADIPEAMYTNKIKEMMSDFNYKLQSQGLDIKTYMKYTGLNEDSFKENFLPQAQKQVKTRLALEKIAKLENVQPSEEDLEKEYDDIAKQYHMDLDKVKSLIRREELMKDLSIKIASDIVKDAAIIL